MKRDHSSRDRHARHEERIKVPASAKIAVLRMRNRSMELMHRHEDALADLRFYKAAVQLAWVVLIGGSLLTYANFNAFLDRRIGERVQKTDQVALALNQAQYGRWRDALATLDEVRYEVEKGALRAEPRFRGFLYENLLWVLANLEEDDTTGVPLGQEQYDALMSDRYFRNNYLTRTDIDLNPDLAHSLGRAILKYDTTQAGRARAYRYLVRASGRDELHARADVHWSLAMFHLAANHPDSAAYHLQWASELHPNEYRFQDLLPYRNSFLNSSEFLVWSKLARQLGNPDFRQGYVDLVSRSSPPEPQR